MRISDTAFILLQHSQGLSRSSSGQSSLANFLSASIAEYVPKISCKLSEDIIRCISAVYCKLASRPSKDADVETSSTPSFSSSSSTFSLNHRVDSWSPRFHYNVNTSSDRYGSLNENNEQYSGMIIFPRIHIDADKFDYASKMLETIRWATVPEKKHKKELLIYRCSFLCLRALIKRLEKIDPTKMAHEEQLCFWINIHNALVMHVCSELITTVTLAMFTVNLRMYASLTCSAFWNITGFYGLWTSGQTHEKYRHDSEGIQLSNF